MKKKLINGIAILGIGFFHFAKGQDIKFFPGDISDIFNIYGNNFDNSGTARYIGMGNSMGALGGDMSAVETNPAGLGVFRNTVAEASIGFLNNKNKTSMSGGTPFSNQETNFNVPNAGIVLNLFDEDSNQDLKFNIGANYTYQKLDNSVYFGPNPSIRYPYPDINGVDQPYIFYGYNQETSGYISRAKFSLASNYLDKIYFGFGLNWNYLSIDKAVTYNQQNTTTGGVESFNEQFTPYSQDATGWGISVGVIGKITPQIRLGAAYHSPVWWSNIDYNFISYTQNSSGDFVSNINYFDGYKNTTPGKFVLSGAFASDIINADNSLAFNFDFINYLNKSDIEFRGSDWEYRFNNSFIENFVQNSQEYRAGLEYRFKELKLRAGYAYASSPVKSQSILGSFNLDPPNAYVKNYLAGDSNKFSVGIGYDLGMYFFDFAYQNLVSNYYTSYQGDFYSVPTANIPSNGIPIFGKVKNTQNNFVFTFGVRL